MRAKTVLILVILLSVLLFGCVEQAVEDDNEVTGHGVTICGIDYACGESDGVCPEDYGAECEVTDPDC